MLAGNVTYHGQSGDSTCIGIVRTAPNLDQRWMKAWGGTGNDGANAVVQDRDSGYVVAGHWGTRLGTSLNSRPIRWRLISTISRRRRMFTLQCAPNPFNSATTLSFSLPRQVHARLAVYDMLGRVVCVLADENFAPGEHRIPFDGSDLPSGIYFAHLRNGEFGRRRSCCC